MAHPYFENGRIQAGLTPEQYYEEFCRQAEASESNLDAEALEKLEFTKLNLHRTNRIMRTYKVADDLKAMLQSIDEPQIWMVLTEPWCGDSAQCLPQITVMTDLNPNIDLRMILRDENLDIMDEYLTNGGRSIPRLVIFDKKGQDLASWGPRPAEAQVVFKESKESGMEKADILKNLHLFYGRNRGAALESEFLVLLPKVLKAQGHSKDEN